MEQLFLARADVAGTGIKTILFLAIPTVAGTTYSVLANQVAPHPPPVSPLILFITGIATSTILAAIVGETMYTELIVAVPLCDCVTEGIVPDAKSRTGLANITIVFQVYQIVALVSAQILTRNI